MHYQIPIIENFYETFVDNLDYYNNQKDYEQLEKEFAFVFDKIVECFEPKIVFTQKAIDFLVTISIDTFFEIDDFTTKKFLSFVEKRNYSLFKSLESEIVYKNTKGTDCVVGYIFFLLERVVLISESLNNSEITLNDVQNLVRDDGMLISCFVLEEANFTDSDSENVSMNNDNDDESTDEYDSSCEMESLSENSDFQRTRGQFSLDYVDNLEQF